MNVRLRWCIVARGDAGAVGLGAVRAFFSPAQTCARPPPSCDGGRGQAKRSKRGTPSKRRGGKERQSGEGEGEGEGEGGELPYAEPLAESLREVAAPVSMLFGQDVARCAFSKVLSALGC